MQKALWLVDLLVLPRLIQSSVHFRRGNRSPYVCTLEHGYPFGKGNLWKVHFSESAVEQRRSKRNQFSVYEKGRPTLPSTSCSCSIDPWPRYILSVSFLNLCPYGRAKNLPRAISILYSGRRAWSVVDRQWRAEESFKVTNYFILNIYIFLY